MKPIFFPSPPDLREWFDEHHTTDQELLVGYYKKLHPPAGIRHGDYDASRVMLLIT